MKNVLVGSYFYTFLVYQILIWITWHYLIQNTFSNPMSFLFLCSLHPKKGFTDDQLFKDINDEVKFELLIYQ